MNFINELSHIELTQYECYYNYFIWFEFLKYYRYTHKILKSFLIVYKKINYIWIKFLIWKFKQAQ